MSAERFQNIGVRAKCVRAGGYLIGVFIRLAQVPIVFRPIRGGNAVINQYAIVSAIGNEQALSVRQGVARIT